jgi:hypothetical protein
MWAATWDLVIIFAMVPSFPCEGTCCGTDRHFVVP